MARQRLSQYLTRYAEPAAQAYAEGVEGQHHRAVVIPMYDEAVDCLARVCGLLPDSDHLIIAVVNAPDTAPAAARARTRTLLKQVAEHTGAAVLTVDALNPPLPAKQAVGLARKLGTDIAVHLYHQGKLASPWLYQTDADAELPADYFAYDPPGRGALVYAHEHHSCDTQMARAAALYDAHMRYYVDQLKQAGSAYAYPTLGSTISVHAESYAAVRGYPKRNAAEDFYLLNKVAKVHGVRYCAGPVIRLTARTSTRVPFGTGPALAEIHRGLEDDPSGAFYLSYDPNSFALLRDTLTFFERFSETSEQPCGPMATVLERIGFSRVSGRILHHYAAPSRRLEILNQWFDAGKSLRFIHEARLFYPDQPLIKILAQLGANQAEQVI